MGNNLTTKIIIGLSGFVALVSIIGAPLLYYFMFSTKVASGEANRKAIANGDPDAVRAKLAELIFVPTGETPEIIPAVNPEFAGMPFFSQAVKGDLAVIYKKAGKIYLFNPVAQKIRDVGSVAAPLSPPAGGTPPTPSLLPSLIASPSASITPTAIILMP